MRECVSDHVRTKQNKFWRNVILVMKLSVPFKKNKRIARGPPAAICTWLQNGIRFQTLLIGWYDFSTISKTIGTSHKLISFICYCTVIRSRYISTSWKIDQTGTSLKRPQWAKSLAVCFILISFLSEVLTVKVAFGLYSHTHV